MTTKTIFFLLLLQMALTWHGAEANVGNVSQQKLALNLDGKTLTLTFRPGNREGLNSGPVIKEARKIPEEVDIVAFKAAVTRSDGTPLPPHYLHHVYLLNMDKKKVSCPGQPALVAGAGMEMMETRFPEGYAVRLEKDSTILAGVAFYHHAPAMNDVVATLTVERAPAGKEVELLEPYQISVTQDCDADQLERPKKGDAEGIQLRDGVHVESVPVKFRVSGCVKFVYPHGHDNLLMLSLENKTARRTLLRTVPEIQANGALLGFSESQIYKSRVGFSVNTSDEYQMTMVYHRPLQDGPRYAMGIYVLYMTLGSCTAA